MPQLVIRSGSTIVANHVEWTTGPRRTHYRCCWVVRIPVVDSIKTEKRVLFKCATGKKTSERVEDKLVILEALEKNLIDYNKLRDQFVEIFEEIKQLNDPTTTS